MIIVYVCPIPSHTHLLRLVAEFSLKSLSSGPPAPRMALLSTFSSRDEALRWLVVFGAIVPNTFKLLKLFRAPRTSLLSFFSPDLTLLPYPLEILSLDGALHGVADILLALALVRVNPGRLLVEDLSARPACLETVINRRHLQFPSFDSKRDYIDFIPFCIV